MDLHSLPRLTLGNWPTPLAYARRLSKSLNCPIFVKRDDMTGVGAGGNKVRKLEFQLAEAMRLGATHVITTGAIQSNHAHLTAAAARRVGMQPVLALSGTLEQDVQGNLLLDRLMDAEIHPVLPDPMYPPLVTMNRIMNELADEIKSRGGIPYIIPEGGTDAIGSVGYVLAIEELVEQLKNVTEVAVTRPLLVVATGTCGTHAGLIAGTIYSGVDLRVVGVSISGNTRIKEEKTRQVVKETLQLLGNEEDIPEDLVIIEDKHIGLRYGAVTDESRFAIRLVARTEGLFLDPVYTGKAMAALIDMAKSEIGRAHV